MSNKYIRTEWTFILTWLIIMLGSMYGWVNNIFKLLGMTDVMTGEGVLRAAGIFLPPLGVVMGYL